MKVNQREKKKAKFRISFIFLFIFASFAVCFTLYMKEDNFVITEDMFEDTADAVVYIEPVGQQNNVVNPVQKSENAGAEYYDDAVFVGSKTLSGLSDYGYVKADNMLLSDSIKLSNINTLTLSENGTESSVAEAVSRKNAGKVYIMTGLYDLADVGNSNLFDNLEAFIDDIKKQNENTEIYLMSVLPLPQEVESTIALNVDIDAYNSLLLKFADKINVNYLDVNTSMKGNDGKLPASAAEVNGIRLKKETYAELSEYILTHVRPYES